MARISRRKFAKSPLRGRLLLLLLLLGICVLSVDITLFLFSTTMALLLAVAWCYIGIIVVCSYGRDRDKQAFWLVESCFCSCASGVSVPSSYLGRCLAQNEEHEEVLCLISQLGTDFSTDSS